MVFIGIIRGGGGGGGGSTVISHAREKQKHYILYKQCFILTKQASKQASKYSM